MRSIVQASADGSGNHAEPKEPVVQFPRKVLTDNRRSFYKQLDESQGENITLVPITNKSFS